MLPGARDRLWDIGWSEPISRDRSKWASAWTAVRYTQRTDRGSDRGIDIWNYSIDMGILHNNKILSCYYSTSPMAPYDIPKRCSFKPWSSQIGWCCLPVPAY